MSPSRTHTPVMHVTLYAPAKRTLVLVCTQRSVAEEASHPVSSARQLRPFCAPPSVVKCGYQCVCTHASYHAATCPSAEVRAPRTCWAHLRPPRSCSAVQQRGLTPTSSHDAAGLPLRAYAPHACSSGACRAGATVDTSGHQHVLPPPTTLPPPNTLLRPPRSRRRAGPCLR